MASVSMDRRQRIEGPHKVLVIGDSAVGKRTEEKTRAIAHTESNSKRLAECLTETHRAIDAGRDAEKANRAFNVVTCLHEWQWPRRAHMPRPKGR